MYKISYIRLLIDDIMQLLGLFNWTVEAVVCSKASVTLGCIAAVMTAAMYPSVTGA